MREVKVNLPESHGLSSKSLLDFYSQIEQLNLNINSFILSQNGKVTSQFYRKPYRKESPQLLFSLSKSFTSIAVGIARDEGYLALTDRVISFFPDKLPDDISDNLSQMTIHHLLSMNAGHHENIYGDVAKETDWVKAYLSMKVEHKPGTHYKYSTHSTYMLSAIVEQVTGESLIEYLLPRLFEPLGISRLSWEACPMGVIAGGMGLSIPTEGIANFGQMLLQRGMFNGHRIVSEEYINLATTKQSDTSRDEERIDFSQGYGYQFFLCRDECFMGNGGYGQLCFIAPHNNIVIVATSSLSNMREQFPTLLNLIYEHILGQIDKDIPHNIDDQKSLHTYLSRITYPFTENLEPSAEKLNINNQSFSIIDNAQQISQISFTTKSNQLEFHMKYEDSTVKSFIFTIDRWIFISGLFIKDLAFHQQEVVHHAIWQEKSVLSLTLIYIETPYVVKYSISFGDQGLDIQCISNAPGIGDYNISGVLI